MGKDGLTFETYKQDPLEREKFAYRYDTLTVSEPVNLSDEEMERRRKLNEKGQKKAEEYADGLHGFEYYSVGGTCVLEVEAVISRYSQIPKDKWVVAKGQTDVDADMQATFSRLRAAAPPEYENYDRSAVQRKALNTEQNKHMKHQLQDYKEMRKNWEQSDQGKTWMQEIERLKAMEDGTLEPEIEISKPTFVRKSITRIPGVNIDPELAGKVGTDLDIAQMEQDRQRLGNARFNRPETAGLLDRLSAKYSQPPYVGDPFHGTITGASFALTTDKSRVAVILQRSLGLGLSNADIESLFDKLNAPCVEGFKDADWATQNAANAQFVTGLKELKQIYYAHLKRIQATYGTLLSDMHPDDFLRQAPEDFDDHFNLLQDLYEFTKGAKPLFNVGDPDDRDFLKLYEYYEKAYHAISHYRMSLNMSSFGIEEERVRYRDMYLAEIVEAEQLRDIGGDGPKVADRKKYGKDVAKRMKKDKKGDYLSALHK